jgi:hypothetical protein
MKWDTAQVCWYTRSQNGMASNRAAMAGVAVKTGQGYFMAKSYIDRSQHVICRRGDDREVQ